MKRKLVWLFLLISTVVPLLSSAQTLTERYIEQRLSESKKYYQQLEYQKSAEILDALYSRSMKEKNHYGAAMALIKKSYYEIDKGSFLKKEPLWTQIEQFKTKNETWNKTLQINVLKLKANYHNTINEHQSAFTYLDQAIKLCQNDPKHNYLLGEIYYLYGQMKVKSSKYIDANEYFLKSMQIFEKLEDDELIGQLYGGLANASFLIGEKERAFDYAKKGVEVLKQQRDYENLCVQLSNLARMYQLGGDTENAIKYFSKSAQYAPKSAKKETQFVKLVDLALVYHSKKDRINALKYMEDAIGEGKKINQPNLHRYIRLGAMFAGYTGNEQLMNKYYQESYALATKAKDKDALRDWYGSQNFYYANIKKDSTKAYPLLEKFHAYKDSIINEKSKKDFNELEVQYQTQKNKQK